MKAILSLSLSTILLMPLACTQKTSETPNPKKPNTQTLKSDIRSNKGVYFPEENMRASSPTNTLETKFEHDGTIYLATIRHNVVEKKMYDVTLEYISGEPVTLQNGMPPKEFFNSIFNCLTDKIGQEAVDCCLATIFQAMSDCKKLGGIHCWFK